MNKDKIQQLQAELSNQSFLQKAPAHIIEKKRKQLDFMLGREDKSVSYYLLYGSEYYEVVRVVGNKFSVTSKMPKVLVDEQIYNKKLNSDFSNVNEVYEQSIKIEEVIEHILN
jgi:hypothetical protein